MKFVQYLLGHCSVVCLLSIYVSVYACLCVCIRACLLVFLSVCLYLSIHTFYIPYPAKANVQLNSWVII